ncbi:MAG: hypothetical protein JXX28_08865 [Deltaproteobacteria bacterium]|nr:hypothetical protein [Deltaproteobacteria bacterium]
MPGYNKSQSKAPAQKGKGPAQSAPTDYGSNMAQKVTVAGPAPQKGGGMKDAMQDMGQVASLDGGFTSKAGGIVDAMVPNDGDSGKLKLNVNLPVDASGTVKVAFEFNTEMSRTDKGVKGKVRLGGGVIASKEADLYFFTAKVFAKIEAFGYMEAEGASGKAVFDLFGLAIHQLVAKESTDLAEAMFSGRYIAGVVKGMRRDDYVEAGLGIEASAGGELGSTTPSGHEISASHDAKAEGIAATRYQKNRKGQIYEKDASKVGAETSVGLKGKLPPFDAAGKLTTKYGKGSLEEIEAELSGEAMISGKELSSLAQGGSLLSGMVSQFGKLIGGTSGMMKDGTAARKVGAFASLVGSATGLGNLATGASIKAIDKMGNMGAKLGHKLSIKGTYDVGKSDFGLELTLERVSEISYGDADKDTFAVVAENIQRVFQIKI